MLKATISSTALLPTCGSCFGIGAGATTDATGAVGCTAGAGVSDRRWLLVCHHVTVEVVLAIYLEDVGFILTRS